MLQTGQLPKRPAPQSLHGLPAVFTANIDNQPPKNPISANEKAFALKKLKSNSIPDRINRLPTALQYPEALLDPQEKRFISNIREHGWTGTYVVDHEGKEPPFYYSCGLHHSVQFAEVIIFGMGAEPSHRLVSLIYADIQEGKPPPVNEITRQMFGSTPSVLIPITHGNTKEFLTWADWFYFRQNFPALELVWPDGAGKFPWEGGCNEEVRAMELDLTDGFRKGKAFNRGD